MPFKLFYVCFTALLQHSFLKGHKGSLVSCSLFLDFCAGDKRSKRSKSCCGVASGSLPGLRLLSSLAAVSTSQSPRQPAGAELWRVKRVVGWGRDPLNTFSLIANYFVVRRLMSAHSVDDRRGSWIIQESSLGEEQWGLLMLSLVDTLLSDRMKLTL